MIGLNSAAFNTTKGGLKSQTRKARGHAIYILRPDYFKATISTRSEMLMEILSSCANQPMPR